MISFGIILILLWSFYIGYNRGLILQVYYSLASLISLIVANTFYKSLDDIVSLWVPYANAVQGDSNTFFDSSLLFKLDSVFYAGLSFLIIYLITYTLLRLVGIFVHLITWPLPFKPITGKLVAGVLSIFVTWIGLEMALSILSTLSVDLVQERLSNSSLANFMIENTPVVASLLRQLWVTDILG